MKIKPPSIFSTEVAQTIQTIGEGVLNAMYPKEFEVYIIALELCGFQDDLINYLVFPVNPESLQIIKPNVVGIKKTFGGLVVTKSFDFFVQTLTLNGSFGKSFHVLTEGFYFKSIAKLNLKNIKDKFKQGEGKEFSQIIKSGFGTIKKLQEIIEQAKEFDEGKPRKLYLHNHMFSESYLIEVKSLRFSQNVQDNMIWKYDMEISILGIIGYGGEDAFKNSMKNKNIKKGVVSKVANNTLHVPKQFIKSMVKL